MLYFMYPLTNRLQINFITRFFNTDHFVGLPILFVPIFFRHFFSFIHEHVSLTEFRSELLVNILQYIDHSRYTSDTKDRALLFLSSSIENTVVCKTILVYLSKSRDLFYSVVKAHFFFFFTLSIHFFSFPFHRSLTNGLFIYSIYLSCSRKQVETNHIQRLKKDANINR